ncbi:unnamed protein product [Acanthoscelides obtectus]|uniref:Endonuclease/exonuclease/phosphatase domain-containing protein n=1 Tax=Acanthoscelides obtectus TaxID=200917 RepID=A0A9P0L491_ACAOB|nr:unnamed protein product [Acanthoscelides obtectus]CAK1624072.1 hypothetical protein AOBTE_LOCUS2313 [Acanthoscelides obtectus]
MDFQEMLETMQKCAKKLDGIVQVHQNTNKGIKEVNMDLKKCSMFLDRESVKQWLEREKWEKVEPQTFDVDCQTYPVTHSVAIQAVWQEIKKDKEVTEENIRRDIQFNAEGFEGLGGVIDLDWPCIRDSGCEVILAGDLNAKSTFWGSPLTDHRGRYLEEWIAELNMTIVNSGGLPTFQRGESRSFIDVTAATSTISTKVTHWKVLPGETLSYNNHIYFELDIQGTTGRKPGGRRSLFDAKAFKENMNTINHANVETPEELMAVLEEATRKSTIHTREEKRKLPYWWTVQIERQREACLKYKRKVTRERAKQRMSKDDWTYRTYTKQLGRS